MNSYMATLKAHDGTGGGSCIQHLETPMPLCDLATLVLIEPQLTLLGVWCGTPGARGYLDHQPLSLEMMWYDVKYIQKGNRCPQAPLISSFAPFGSLMYVTYAGHANVTGACHALPCD
jgi:hypothetical protein